MDLLARDVLALLDVLLVKKAVVLGHSMGGYVALAAWRLAAERFLALGLISSQAGADTEEGRQGRYRLAAKVAGEGKGEGEGEGTNAVVEAMLPKLFRTSLPAETPLIEQVRQLMLHTPSAGIVGSLQGMAVRPDCTGLLPNISVPVLILAGDEDQIIAPDKAKAMAAAMKTPTLTFIANAGHMPMMEQPQATTTAIEGFLRTAGNARP